MADHGILQFDYASGKRPPLDSHALDETSFNQILQILETCPDKGIFFMFWCIFPYP